jgi:hypothetical protein
LTKLLLLGTCARNFTSGNFTCSDEVHTKVLRSAGSFIYEYSGVSGAIARQKNILSAESARMLPQMWAQRPQCLENFLRIC